MTATKHLKPTIRRESPQHIERTLQIMAARLIEAQEKERRRIGRELHDGFTQQLAMFAVELGMLARQVPSKETSVIESILALRERAESLSEDVRHISHQLHPVALEYLGLKSALRSLCAEYTKNSGVHVWFSHRGQTEEVIPPETAICLYRIAQEALRNIVKHSRAKVAWIKISHIPGGVRLCIVDKGVGFCLDSAQKTGLGLVSMKERVQIVHGRIEIKSVPTVGTAIRITLPVNGKEQESVNTNEQSKAHSAAG